MGKQIFRKAALDRLSSPEELDTLTQVTRPTGWLALLAVGLILGAALLWGVFGAIPTLVMGSGILIREGGVLDVVSLGGGQVTEVVVDVGEVVRRGQVVARVAQPVLLNEIHNAKAAWEEAKTQHEQLGSFHDKALALHRDTLAAKRKNLGTAIENYDVRRDFNADQLKKQEALLKDGLTTPEQVETIREKVASANEEIAQLRVQMDDIALQLQNREQEAQRDVLQSQHEVDGLLRQVKFLENQLSVDSRVVSMYAGRVVEVKADVGDVLTQRSPILSLEPSRETLLAVIYVSHAEGKMVRAGMEIDICPTTAKREEYGGIVGLVRHVAEYPASNEGMLRTLGANQALVQDLSQGGAPIEIRADLIPDASTASGYKWTSSSGPSMTISSGTRCAGLVTVESRRPISLVIPYVKETLAIY